MIGIGESDWINEASEQNQDGFVRCFLYFYDELVDELGKNTKCYSLIHLYNLLIV